MASITVVNANTDLSGNTLITEENAYTITGLHTFSRSTNAPFAVNSGAAVVANLDADKLDGVEGSAFVKAAGTVALSANWDAGGYEIRSNTFESDVATGTIPLVIASTTKCTNLNADKLDDQEGSYYIDPGNLSSAVAVNKGGTGATTLTDGGVLLGSGPSAITATAVLGDGVILIGDASGDPTTLDVGSSTAITVLGTVATGVWQGTDVGVAYGGTGVSTFTDGGVLLGSGASAITAMAVLTAGQMIVGDGSGDPVAESGATLRTSVGVGTGDSPQFTGLTVSGTGASALDVGGGLNIGTGDVSLVGTDGKLEGPLSSTIIDDLSGANLTTLNASNISSGTLAAARLPAKVTVTSSDADALDVTGGLTIGSGDVALVGVDGKLSGPLSTTIIDDLSGANLTTLNASNLSSGTVATARLGSGTASSSTFLRGDGSWNTAGATSPIVGYTATTANVSNTTSKSPVVTVGQIGADDWDDGDILTISLAAQTRNYSGSSRTVTWEVNVEGNAQTHVKSWENLSGIGYNWWEFSLMRAGAEIYWGFTNDQITRSGMNPGDASNLRIASVDFTAAIDVVINITFPAADATLYITPQSANARLIKRTT